MTAHAAARTSTPAAERREGLSKLSSVTGGANEARKSPISESEQERADQCSAGNCPESMVPPHAHTPESVD